VGLAQILLKEAWIRVEAGFRPGREMILQKERTSIGRAEGSDIALFGDAGVEKTHANIVLDAGRYYLEDLQSPGGSFVNEQKVAGRTALKAGDLIRIGKSVLRFNERTKRND
jgi:pSer/pThr/pTyr-binding forkhead associated (FHA) protein